MIERHGVRAGLGGPREMAPSIPKAQDLVQRQNSCTAQLIRRYELISGNSADSPSLHPPSRSRLTRRTTSNGEWLKSRQNRRSISDSLRNLISAFRRGKSHGKGTDVTERISTEIRDSAPLQTGSSPKGLLDLNTPVFAASNLPEEPSRPVYSGILLYFARPALASELAISRVWTTCKVTLFPSHLLVTWFTSHGNPASRPISLLSAAAVRHLDLEELRPEEEALLPMRSDDDMTKVFEISFRDGTSEKFAATSVAERVKWVNMLCDAITPSLESSTEALQTVPSIGHETNYFPGSIRRADRTLVTNSPPSASVYSTSLYPPSTTTAGVTTDTPDHSLPPTPLSIKTCTPVDTHSGFSNISPHRPIVPPFPPSKSPSQASASTTGPQTFSGSKSPSILKLGSLSLVSQRLTQIETSPFRLRSPLKALDNGTDAPLTPKSARIRRAFEEIDRVQEKYDSEEKTSEALLMKPLLPHLLIPDSWSQLSPPIDQAKRVIRATPIANGCTIESVFRNSPKILSTSYSSGPETMLKLEALQNLVQQVFTQQCDQNCGVVELINSLHDNVQSLHEVLRRVVVDSGDTSASKASFDFTEAFQKIESSLLKALMNTERVQAATTTTQGDETRTKIDAATADVLRRLDGLRETWFTAKHSIQDVDSIMVMKDLPELPAEGPDLKDATRLGDTARRDFTDIQDKLHNLLNLIGAKHGVLQTEQGQPDDAVVDNEAHSHCGEKLHEILDRLDKAEKRMQHQEEQQTECLRYLKELNMWLDTFVNDGTTQIQAIFSNIQHLSRELGCEDVPIDTQNVGQKPGLLNTVHQLLEAHLANIESTKVLHASVEGLATSVKDQLKGDTRQRNVLIMDSIAELVNQQRSEQEQMLRGLSSELTEEIRGERLRFVEAMKEATAINVQGHVEHFKSELTREVIAMTEEVGLLHKQKQTLEQQIAELFTFYSRRKTDAEKVVQQEQTVLRRQRNNIVQIVQNVPPSRMLKQRPLPAPFS